MSSHVPLRDRPVLGRIITEQISSLVVSNSLHKAIIPTRHRPPNGHSFFTLPRIERPR